MGRDTSESDCDLSVCHKSFELEDHLQRRKQNFERIKNHKCDFNGCEKTFYRPSKLEAHRRLHEGKRPFVCSYAGCSKAYTNSSHLKRHMKVGHEKHQSGSLFVCPEKGCEATLKTRQCLKKHIKRRHTNLPYQCQDCDAKFKRNHQLKEHTFVHTGTYPYVCEECKKGFEKSYDLKRHQRSHRTYTCRLKNCSVTFSSMSLYRKHMATVHRPDYTCAVCDKKFKTLGNLKGHYLTHKDSETYGCSHENCESVFSQKRYLKQHLNSVHAGLHEYKCPVEGCQKVFKWKRSLIHHVKLHSMKKSRKIKKTQKERKDKGQPKKCLAAELANVTLPAQMHKEIILGEQETVNSDQEIIEYSCANDGEELANAEYNAIKSKKESAVIGDGNVYLVEGVIVKLVCDSDSEALNKGELQRNFNLLESEMKKESIGTANPLYPVENVIIEIISDDEGRTFNDGESCRCFDPLKINEKKESMTQITATPDFLVENISVELVSDNNTKEMIDCDDENVT